MESPPFLRFHIAGTAVKDTLGLKHGKWPITLVDIGQVLPLVLTVKSIKKGNEKGMFIVKVALVV